MAALKVLYLLARGALSYSSLREFSPFLYYHPHTDPWSFMRNPSALPGFHPSVFDTRSFGAHHGRIKHPSLAESLYFALNTTQTSIIKMGKFSCIPKDWLKKGRKIFKENQSIKTHFHNCPNYFTSLRTYLDHVLSCGLLTVMSKVIFLVVV